MNPDIWLVSLELVRTLTAQPVPTGKLERGESYLFLVKAYDHGDWIIYNNHLSSNWYPLLTLLSTFKVMPWTPLLLLDD